MSSNIKKNNIFSPCGKIYIRTNCLFLFPDIVIQARNIVCLDCSELCLGIHKVHYEHLMCISLSSCSSFMKFHFLACQILNFKKFPGLCIFPALYVIHASLCIFLGFFHFLGRMTMFAILCFKLYLPIWCMHYLQYIT